MEWTSSALGAGADAAAGDEACAAGHPKWGRAGTSWGVELLGVTGAVYWVGGPKGPSTLRSPTPRYYSYYTYVGSPPFNRVPSASPCCLSDSEAKGPAPPR